MAIVTRTLRDTVVNAPGAGGTVTIKVDIEDDAAANGAILDASALSGHANGAKLHIARIWWALTQGSADDDTGHVEIQEVSSGTDIVQIRLAGTGHYDGSAGVIPGTAANTTATSGDHEITTFGTSGFVIIEFKKTKTIQIKDRTMKLFSEAVEEVEYICEAKEDGSKNYKIRGIFMQADIKNRNGRVYPMEILNNEVEKYNKNFIKENRAFGELGHPDGPTVNLERVSHMITSLTPEKKNFIGEAKIMSTPMGEIVKSLMDEGAKLGVSSRGMGSLDQKGGANYVRDDFYLATAADIVADPSAPNAFVEGIMEGKEWVWNNGALLESEMMEMKKEFDVKERQRNANREALAFAKFLKRL